MNSPNVTIEDGMLIGAADGGTNKYLGIPFAQPPIGKLRFAPPQQPANYSGVYDASVAGAGCPGFDFGDFSTFSMSNPAEELNTMLSKAFPPPDAIDEDCLTLNVWAPSETKPGADLPVLVVRGFVSGAGSSYNGSVIVERWIELGSPLVYVNLNYRKEVKDANATNLGLRDQRMALEWVNRHIGAFGGDPTKVTIWGESSGAMSVVYQMLHNNGSHNGLFSAAFKDSGTPEFMHNFTDRQDVYDKLVKRADCSHSEDRLGCLKDLSPDALQKGLRGISFRDQDDAFQPAVDREFIQDMPRMMVLRGQIANVPFMTGNCDDDDTLLASIYANHADTDNDVAAILKSTFPNATPKNIAKVMALYPPDVTQGAPFDTGYANALSLQYKRLAAIMTDDIFHSPRRFLLRVRSRKQPVWSFPALIKPPRHATQAHQSELLSVYAPGVMTDYLIRFAAHLDPNGGPQSQSTQVYWPQYDLTDPQLLTFYDL
ncbi:hypothetical protein CERSUDRAFT_65576 [Gelatoporia subvermispora B]|uniref:Carboxylic ester hydrolase n=1 Tax=Ceriporiopsis subvermispora (strain B) TaxID=914234 RepID=M2QIB7_CERS8|nr:hypothetical protein CERSUDRAFT_65576 [Gelatoporia subvermispora B]